MKPFDEMQTNLRSWSGALQEPHQMNEAKSGCVEDLRMLDITQHKCGAVARCYPSWLSKIAGR